MDFDLMINSFPKLLNASLITLKLLFASLFFGLFIGLFFAILRVSKNKLLNKFSYGFSYLFRAFRIWSRSIILMFFILPSWNVRLSEK